MKEENWALPIMQTLILDLRNFARRADKRCSGKPGERQEKAAGTMMNAFRVCVADNRAKADDTKKWGMLFVVNQLFKVCCIRYASLVGRYGTEFKDSPDLIFDDIFRLISL